MVAYLIFLGILAVSAFIIIATAHFVYLYYDKREQINNFKRRNTPHKYSNPITIGLRYIHVAAIGGKNESKTQQLECCDSDDGGESEGSPTEEIIRV